MDAIDLQLAQLESAGLIRQVAEQPERAYLFQHALIQEVAYESLLKADRRRLHLAAGNALEELYPERREELAPLLARHFYEAGEDTRAIHYFTLAGDRAYRHYANAEAVGHYTHALQLVREKAAGTALLINLYTRRGRALELQGHYAAALANYHEMETQAHVHGDQALELAALLALATIHVTETPEYDPQRGQALCDQALALAWTRGDRPAEARILWNLCLLCRATGRLDEAIAYGEQSLSIARALNLREQVAQTLHDLSYFYIGTGRQAQGQAALQEAGRLWREAGNLPMLADNLTTSALRDYLAGDLDQAIATAEDARAITRAIGNQWGQAYSDLILAQVHIAHGDFDRALPALNTARRLAERTGFRAGVVIGSTALAVIHADFGAVAPALTLSRQAVETAEQVPVWRALALAGQAVAQTQAGDRAAAAASIHAAQTHLPDGDPLTDQVLLLAEGLHGLARGDFAALVLRMEAHIAALRHRGIRLFVGDALYYIGRALLEQGRLDAAWPILIEARRESEATGARCSLWPALAALGEIEAGRGHAAAAATLYQEAADIVNYIAAHAGSPELREGFLNRPAVQGVLDRTAL